MRKYEPKRLNLASSMANLDSGPVKAVPVSTERFRMVFRGAFELLCSYFARVPTVSSITSATFARTFASELVGSPQKQQEGIPNRLPIVADQHENGIREA